MTPAILTISDRGQITLPKKVRSQLKSHHFSYHFDGANFILSPLQTREDFLRELDEAEKDWEENGGVPWDEVMKKSQKLA